MTKYAHRQMIEALDLCIDVLEDIARLDDGTPAISALRMARDALAAAPAAHAKLLEVLRLVQRALNTAPRFTVGETDSYKIAARVDRTLEELSI